MSCERRTMSFTRFLNWSRWSHSQGLSNRTSKPPSPWLTHRDHPGSWAGLEGKKNNTWEQRKILQEQKSGLCPRKTCKTLRVFVHRKKNHMRQMSGKMKLTSPHKIKQFRTSCGLCPRFVGLFGGEVPASDMPFNGLPMHHSHAQEGSSMPNTLRRRDVVPGLLVRKSKKFQRFIS